MIYIGIYLVILIVCIFWNYGVHAMNEKYDRRDK